MLTFKAPKDVRGGRPFNVEVGFTNALPISLTSVILHVEGPGLIRPAKYNLG